MSFPGLYFSDARTVRKDKPKKKTTTTTTTSTTTDPAPVNVWLFGAGDRDGLYILNLYPGMPLLYPPPTNGRRWFFSGVGYSSNLYIEWREHYPPFSSTPTGYHLVQAVGDDGDYVVAYTTSSDIFSDTWFYEDGSPWPGLFTSSVSTTTTTSTTTALIDDFGNPMHIFGDGFTGIYAVFNGEYVAVSQSTQYDGGPIITNNYVKVGNSLITCIDSVDGDRWQVINGTDFIGRVQTNSYAALLNTSFNDWQGNTVAGTMVTAQTTTTTPTTTTSTTTHSAYEQLLVSGFDYPDINGTYSRPYGSVWFEPYVKLGGPPEMLFEIDAGNWILNADFAPRYYSSTHGGLLSPAECTWYVYAPQTTVGTVVHL
jgi:hypothetical protein